MMKGIRGLLEKDFRLFFRQGGTADILLRPFSGTEFFVCQFCYYNMNCENCFCNGAICGYQVRVRFYVTVHFVLSNDFSSLTL